MLPASYLSGTGVRFGGPKVSAACISERKVALATQFPGPGFLGGGAGPFVFLLPQSPLCKSIRSVRILGSYARGGYETRAGSVYGGKAFRRSFSHPNALLYRPQSPAACGIRAPPDAGHALRGALAASLSEGTAPHASLPGRPPEPRALLPGGRSHPTGQPRLERQPGLVISPNRKSFYSP